MTAITFDTLQVVKSLESKGFTPEQAEGISEALKASLQSDELASKADIRSLQMETQELKFDMRLLKWMVGVNTAGLVFIIALLTKALSF
ncbi:MAG: CCDC90 family protein [Zoogloeaceae bacterium]|jgi:hypothetical protein|nr:CCDC90 family protein [Zoogloeaceae bacterium]